MSSSSSISSPSSAPPLIVLGVTGSIAAYKAASLLRLLIDDGFRVKTAMTPAATKFIGSMTLEALSGEPVYLDQTELSGTIADKAPAHGQSKPDAAGSGIVHTDISAEMDLLLVAPATADIIAKIAYGFGDDPVSALALALRRDASLLIAPAMNPRMWSNPAVQANIDLLRSRGAMIVGPASGSTACGDIGVGRMSEPDEIAAWARRALASGSGSGSGTSPCNRSKNKRRILILSGPTREHIDDVRFLSNGSSGAMGAALAKASFESGHDVTVISGPAAIMPPAWIKTLEVESASEMFNAAKTIDCDIVFSPAAIADYAPTVRLNGKPAKAAALTIETTATVDVLPSLHSAWKSSSAVHPPVIVAFAAESDDKDLDDPVHVEGAIKKARRKGASYIVLNRAVETMGSDTATVKLIDVESGQATSLGPDSKTRLARTIVEQIVYGAGHSGK